MADSVELFKEQYPSLESYWRAIILFGRNVATYKFALAESLLELASQGKTEVTLQELAVPYSKHLCRHLEEAPKQVTSASSKFLTACADFNKGLLNRQTLLDTTVSLGFNNVIDAFHIVNGAPIPIEFYKKDYSPSAKKIILTDEIFKLKETPHAENYDAEAEARWHLVEKAWELGISKDLMFVRYDDDGRRLYVIESNQRKNVTSARNALNGYQKGKCFYCFDGITVIQGLDTSCDVDHFFPHMLQPHFPDVNLDGVWNLVLACKPCNRGEQGKHAGVPELKYLERLHRRNEFLISSHHPLRETIIQQTGKTEQDRIAFLKMMDRRAIDLLIHRWDTEQRATATF